VSILVAGEALIDFFPANCGERRGFVPFPGGSPCNVAVGLGRLGVPVAFLGRISKDPFGRILKAHLYKSNVNLDYLSEGNEQSTISFIQLDGLKEPGFGFYGTHTVDAQLTVNLLPRMLPSEIQAIHLGSLAMIRQPIGSSEHGKRMISFDPNIRSNQIEDRDNYLAKLQHWVKLADMVKASRSDIDYLYPGMSPDAVAKEWLALGPYREGMARSRAAPHRHNGWAAWGSSVQSLCKSRGIGRQCCSASMITLTASAFPTSREPNSVPRSPTPRV